jgi:F-type H+-transporting ATPase subunit alpha
MGLWEQVATMLSAGQGVFDDVPLEKLKHVQHAILSVLKADHKKLIDEVNKGAALTDEQKETILKAARSQAKNLGA